jgi:hypothetical protein
MNRLCPPRRRRRSISTRDRQSLPRGHITTSRKASELCCSSPGLLCPRIHRSDSATAKFRKNSLDSSSLLRFPIPTHFLRLLSRADRKMPQVKGDSADYILYLQYEREAGALISQRSGRAPVRFFCCRILKPRILVSRLADAFPTEEPRTTPK